MKTTFGDNISPAERWDKISEFCACMIERIEQCEQEMQEAKEAFSVIQKVADKEVLREESGTLNATDEVIVLDEPSDIAAPNAPSEETVEAAKKKPTTKKAAGNKKPKGEKVVPKGQESMSFSAGMDNEDG